MGDGDGGFDFDAYRKAFEAKDVARWIRFYADDAEWVEYRDATPPRSPRRKSGKQAIEAFMRSVAASAARFHIADEVLGSDRIAFRVSGELAGDRRLIEHVIVHIRNGKIVRQIDVEAWD